MKSKEIIYSILFFCVFIASSNAQESPRGSVVQKTEQNYVGTKRALIVGISDYQAKDLKLKYAENDARQFEEYLKTYEKVEEIVTLTGNEATAINIQKELNHLYQVSESGDVVYIYFAGHGDVVELYGEDIGFLLAVDVNNQREYYGTSGVVELEKLNKAVNNISKKNVTVFLIIDACRSGFSEKLKGTQDNLKVLSDNFQNATKFLSCGPDQLSYESTEIEHGFFTYYLVLGLMGAADYMPDDNEIKFYELQVFLDEKVKNKTSNNQVPVIITQTPNDIVRSVESKEKELALETLKNSFSLHEALASRGGTPQTEGTDAYNDPLVKQFNQAIKNNNYYGAENSAYAIYNKALKQKDIDVKVLDKMKYGLVNHFSSSAQILINKYIGNQELLPSGLEFEKQAGYLGLCIEILDKEDFNYERILVSKLFLEAYTIIRNKNYSNYKTAKQKLQEALAIEPRAAYIHNALGILYSHEENYEQSLFHYNKAKELIPTWSFPINNIGTVYHNMYQYETAKKYYKTASEIIGVQSTSNLNLGVVYQTEGKYTLAEKQYKKALEFDQNNIKAIQDLGNLYQMRGNIKKANEYFQKAIQVDSANFLKEYGLNDYIRDFSISDKKAETLYLQAIEDEPFYANVYADYADFLRNKYSHQPDKLLKADSLYQKAIQNDPFYTWAYAGRGWLLNLQKKTDKALASFLKGIEVNPTKESSYYYLANYYRNALKDYEQAEKYYLKALEINPYYQYAVSDLIDLYNTQDQKDKPISLINSAIEKNPENPSNWNLKGDHYFSLKDYSSAVQAYLQAIQLDPDNANGYSNLSICYLELGQTGKALELYSKAIESNPIKNKKEILTTYILSLFREKNKNGETAQAQNLIEAAYMLNQSTEAAFTLAEFYYLNNIDKNTETLIQNTIDQTDSKSWLIKLYELGLKVSVEKNNTKETERFYRELEASNIKINPVLEMLYLYQTKGKAEARQLKNAINKLYLEDTYLKPRFNEKTIQMIKNLN